MNETIVIIPAKGSSRSIPHKNLQSLGKYTLLEHTIADAYELKCPVYVTTEDDRTGLIAEESGAVYIKRPNELAQDDSRTEDAVINALELLSVPPETIVVLLQCTSSFRMPGELTDALNYLKKGYCDSMYSAYALFQFAWTEEERLIDPIGTRPMRQLKNPLYIEDGSFYISRAWCYYEHNNRLAGRIGRWVHNKIYGLEVDEWDDLEIARLLYPWLKKSGRV